MSRISGYFFDGSKSGGFCTHVWIFLPSKLVYQISSGSVSLICENSFSLKFVSCLGADPLASATYKSPILVGVEISSANFDPSFEALKETTSCFPSVTEEILPDCVSKRFKLPVPCFPTRSTIALPDQSGLDPPPPRGGAWSPPTPDPMS